MHLDVNLQEEQAATACDPLPLCFVESKGFCKLMHCIEGEYTVLSRTMVTSQLEFSLMFSTVHNIHNKRRNVLNITKTFKLKAWKLS